MYCYGCQEGRLLGGWERGASQLVIYLYLYVFRIENLLSLVTNISLKVSQILSEYQIKRIPVAPRSRAPSPSSHITAMLIGIFILECTLSVSVCSLLETLLSLCIHPHQNE